jgi:hypothetical protein
VRVLLRLHVVVEPDLLGLGEVRLLRVREHPPRLHKPDLRGGAVERRGAETGVRGRRKRRGGGEGVAAPADQSGSASRRAEQLGQGRTAKVDR